MILTNARKLVGALKQLKESQTSEKTLQEYQVKADDLKNFLSMLEPEVTAWLMYRECQLPMGDHSDDAEWLESKIATIRERLEEEASWIIDFQGYRTIARPFEERLRNLSTRLKNDRERAWGDFTKAKIPGTKQRVPEAFGRMKRFEKAVANVRQCEVDVEAKRTKVPKQRRDVDDFLTAVRKLEEACASLDFHETSPAVKAFIQVATSTGATYAHLTPEVITELEGLDLLGALRLRLD